MNKRDNTDVMDVSDIDNSTFALERELIKLEMLPPGHEATNIIPKATEACGLKMTMRI